MAPSTPTLTRSTDIFKPSYALAGAANFGLMLFNNAGSKLLALELQAAETDSRNKTISSPRIVTLNRKAATINNTQQVTILSGVNATTGLPIYQTFSAPLTLGVTPSVNPDNRISLDLNIAKSTITNATTGSLDTNTVTTNVIVENGGTVVIGGLRGNRNCRCRTAFPSSATCPTWGIFSKPRQRAMRAASCWFSLRRASSATRSRSDSTGSVARTRGRLVCRPRAFCAPRGEWGRYRGAGHFNAGPRERISWRNRPATEVQSACRGSRADTIRP
jgi:hypothetical protein